MAGEGLRYLLLSGHGSHRNAPLLNSLASCVHGLDCRLREPCPYSHSDRCANANGNHRTYGDSYSDAYSRADTDACTYAYGYPSS